MTIVAAFDFDGTLLQGDCLLLFHRLLKGRAGMAVDWIRLLPALLAWKSGYRSTAWFKQHYLCNIISGSDSQKRRHILEHDLPQLLRQKLRPEAVARFHWHNRQGHCLVIVSASPRDLIRGVASELQAELIATETSPLGGDPPARPLQLTSANCKGAEKVRRLEAWLGQPLAAVELHAYGDSKGDRELLQAATHPHWRQFTAEIRAYPPVRRIPRGWIAMLGLVLLSLALSGLGRLEPNALQLLLQALQRLPAFLPAIYGVLALAYLGRYWRWRLLLGAEGIGRWSLQDARAWFCGFALTATPGKLGELSRVADLHQQLGYPRAPLLHVFVAERLCDLIAVGLWLVVLLPSTVVTWVVAQGSWTTLAAVFTGVTILLVLGRWCRQRWWQHLPSGAQMRACLPAAAVSLGIWGGESVILWLLVQALSPSHAIALDTAVSTYLLSGTAGMLSSLPGGIGVNEGTATLLLTQAGLPAAMAFTIAVLRRLCTVWSITLLAIWVRLLQTD
ncbi:MAG: HAD-IB family hydrolase [Cyanobacteria bacterium]|nr:HAD-IB family hydrolase [Cyanobacteriota bacterium]